MSELLDKLTQKMAEIVDLASIQAVLGYDQQVFMPEGGAEGRGYQLAALGGVVHEKSTSDEIGRLLEDAANEIGDLNADTDEARMVKVAKRVFDKQRIIPQDMLMEFIKVTSDAHEVWVKARKENNFSRFQPYLERIVELRRAYSDLFKPYDHVYDPQLDDFEPGMKTADVKAIFDRLRPKQIELLRAIADAKQVDNSFIKQHYEQADQEKFGREVLTTLGYDWKRGRLDVAAHPFTSSMTAHDVRVTTRYLDDDGFSAFFSTAHEGGHAMYEQNVNPKYARTVLMNGASMAIHESQSRLWENLVGRSKAFWQYFYPKAQALFPKQLGNVSLDVFYKGINKVEPSLIRVESDEATYNMHIMLRLEIELALMERTIEVKDLPEVWNTRMQEFLGIVPPNDALGVMQDVHWSSGYFGYFPTYALGNLVSAQLWYKMLEEKPNIPDEIAQGKMSSVLQWMRDNIHQYGTKYEPQELVMRVTGSKIDPDPYVRYLTEKYTEIYNL